MSLKLAKASSPVTSSAVNDIILINKKMNLISDVLLDFFSLSHSKKKYVLFN